MKTEISNKGTKGSWLMALLLALMTIALYWPATSHDFISYDDPAYVTNNPRVQAGVTWEGVVWAFGRVHGEETYWHPLTWVSHMLDCQWYGLKPWGHHLTSVLLHAVNVALLFLVLKGMQNAECRMQKGGGVWLCAMVAALFAGHPLQVDAVAWVAERKTLLSAFFWLLAMGAYVRYAQVQSLRSKVQSPKSKVQSQEATGRDTQHAIRNTQSASILPLPSSIFYLLSLTFFALGLMCKPVLVTFPFVLLLLDYWPLRRFGVQNREGIASSQWSVVTSKAAGADDYGQRTTDHGLRCARKSQIAYRTLLEKVPFLVLAGASSVITLLAHNALGMLEQVPWDMRIENALVSYVRYLGKLCWPSRLAVFYPYPMGWPLWEVAACGLLLLVVSGLALGAARRRPWWFLGWFWFAGVLVPFIGLVQAGAQAMADRFMYLPAVGFFFALIWGLGEAARGGTWQRRGIQLAGGAVVVGCLLMTRQQIGYWVNSETLFRHALAVTENNYLAHKAVGDVLNVKGRSDEAVRHYREAIRLKPDYALARNNFGALLARQKKYDEAIAQFSAVLRADPGQADAHCNLGLVLNGQGDFAGAAAHYAEAARLRPKDLEIRQSLGLALLCQGKLAEAAVQFEAVLQARPNAAAHYYLALALDGQGQAEAAVAHYREAIRLEPQTPLYLNDLAWLLATSSRDTTRNGAEAVRLAQEACRLSGGKVARFWGTLDAAYAEAGRFDEAVATATKTRDMALAAGQPDVATAAKERLALYRAGKPYRSR